MIWWISSWNALSFSLVSNAICFGRTFCISAPAGHVCNLQRTKAKQHSASETRLGDKCRAHFSKKRHTWYLPHADVYLQRSRRGQMAVAQFKQNKLVAVTRVLTARAGQTARVVTSQLRRSRSALQSACYCYYRAGSSGGAPAPARLIAPHRVVISTSAQRNKRAFVFPLASLSTAKYVCSFFLCMYVDCYIKWNRGKKQNKSQKQALLLLSNAVRFY